MFGQNNNYQLSTPFTAPSTPVVNNLANEEKQPLRSYDNWLRMDIIYNDIYESNRKTICEQEWEAHQEIIQICYIIMAIAFIAGAYSIVNSKKLYPNKKDKSSLLSSIASSKTKKSEAEKKAQAEKLIKTEPVNTKTKVANHVSESDDIDWEKLIDTSVLKAEKKAKQTKKDKKDKKIRTSARYQKAANPFQAFSFTNFFGSRPSKPETIQQTPTQTQASQQPDAEAKPVPVTSIPPSTSTIDITTLTGPYQLQKNMGTVSVSIPFLKHLAENEAHADLLPRLKFLCEAGTVGERKHDSFHIYENNTKIKIKFSGSKDNRLFGFNLADTNKSGDFEINAIRPKHGSDAGVVVKLSNRAKMVCQKRQEAREEKNNWWFKPKDKTQNKLGEDTAKNKSSNKAKI